MLRSNSYRLWKRIISFVLIITFILGPNFSYAQVAFVSTLPEPGTMVMTSDAFVPVLVKGLVVHPDKPLNFDFIVDSGNDSSDQQVVKDQSQRMAQYFLAAITVPEEQLWVNLSPYEKDRVIENELGQTVLGRDMLAQDYLLKQLTSSMIYPEKGLGKEFWARVYAEAQAKFGTTDIPVDTFNKVWIMPEKAEVFEKGNAVYVTEAKLKVMLDSDRVAMSNQKDMAESRSPARDTAMTENASDAVTDEKSAVAKAVMSEIIVPAIEKEVNEGKNFAAIRQVYHAAILAKWYRELIQNTLLADAYVGKNKVEGVTSDEKALKEEIYQRYIAAYKKGVFNYIKEESDASGETIPRKYFSGGEEFSRIDLKRTGSAVKAASHVGRTFKVDLAMSAGDMGVGRGDAAMKGDREEAAKIRVEEAEKIGTIITDEDIKKEINIIDKTINATDNVIRKIREYLLTYIREDLENKNTIPLSYGTMISSAPGFNHTIRNMNPDVPSKDWTFKDIMLNLFRFSGDKTVADPTITKVHKTQHADGNSIEYDHILKDQVLGLDIDDNFEVSFIDEDSTGFHNPAKGKVADVKFRMITIVNGQESKKIPFEELYDGLQIIRIMPWPRALTKDWEFKRDGKKVRANIKVFMQDANGVEIVEELRNVEGGTQVILNNSIPNRERIITHYQIENVSENDYELDVVAPSRVGSLRDPGISNAEEATKGFIKHNEVAGLLSKAENEAWLRVQDRKLNEEEKKPFIEISSMIKEFKLKYKILSRDRELAITQYRKYLEANKNNDIQAMEALHAQYDMLYKEAENRGEREKNKFKLLEFFVNFGKFLQVRHVKDFFIVNSSADEFQKLVKFTTETEVKAKITKEEDVYYLKRHKQVATIDSEHVAVFLTRQYPAFNLGLYRWMGATMTEAENPKGYRQNIHVHSFVESTISGSDDTGYINFNSTLASLVDKDNLGDERLGAVLNKILIGDTSKEDILFKLMKKGKDALKLKDKKDDFWTRDNFAEQEIFTLVNELNNLQAGEKVVPKIKGKSLRTFPDGRLLIKYIQNNSVIKDPEDIKRILLGKLDYEERLSPKGEPKTSAAILYDSIFDQDKLPGKSMNLVLFRREDEGQQLTNLLKNVKNVSVQVIVGGIDDGDSWYEAARFFNATGIPTAGKALLDLAEDEAVRKFLELRFDDLTVAELNHLIIALEHTRPDGLITSTNNIYEFGKKIIERDKEKEIFKRDEIVRYLREFSVKWNGEFSLKGISLRNAVIVGAAYYIGDKEGTSPKWQEAVDAIGKLLGLSKGNQVILPTEERQTILTLREDGILHLSESSLTNFKSSAPIKQMWLINSEPAKVFDKVHAALGDEITLNPAQGNYAKEVLSSTKSINRGKIEDAIERINGISSTAAGGTLISVAKKAQDALKNATAIIYSSDHFNSNVAPSFIIPGMRDAILSTNEGQSKIKIAIDQTKKRHLETNDTDNFLKSIHAYLHMDGQVEQSEISNEVDYVIGSFTTMEDEGNLYAAFSEVEESYRVSPIRVKFDPNAYEDQIFSSELQGGIISLLGIDSAGFRIINQGEVVRKPANASISPDIWKEAKLGLFKNDIKVREMIKKIKSNMLDIKMNGYFIIDIDDTFLPKSDRDLTSYKRLVTSLKNFLSEGFKIAFVSDQSNVMIREKLINAILFDKDVPAEAKKNVVFFVNLGTNLVSYDELEKGIISTSSKYNKINAIENPEAVEKGLVEALKESAGDNFGLTEEELEYYINNVVPENFRWLKGEKMGRTDLLQPGEEVKIYAPNTFGRTSDESGQAEPVHFFPWIEKRGKQEGNVFYGGYAVLPYFPKDVTKTKEDMREKFIRKLAGILGENMHVRPGGRASVNISKRLGDTINRVSIVKEILGNKETGRKAENIYYIGDEVYEGGEDSDVANAGLGINVLAINTVESSTPHVMPKNSIVIGTTTLATLELLEEILKNPNLYPDYDPVTEENTAVKAAYNLIFNNIFEKKYFPRGIPQIKISDRIEKPFEADIANNELYINKRLLKSEPYLLMQLEKALRYFLPDVYQKQAAVRELSIEIGFIERFLSFSENEKQSLLFVLGRGPKDDVALYQWINDNLKLKHGEKFVSLMNEKITKSLIGFLNKSAGEVNRFLTKRKEESGDDKVGENELFREISSVTAEIEAGSKVIMNSPQSGSPQYALYQRKDDPSSKERGLGSISRISDADTIKALEIITSSFNELALPEDVVFVPYGSNQFNIEILPIIGGMLEDSINDKKQLELLKEKAGSVKWKELVREITASVPLSVSFDPYNIVVNGQGEVLVEGQSNDELNKLRSRLVNNSKIEQRNISESVYVKIGTIKNYHMLNKKQINDITNKIAGSIDGNTTALKNVNINEISLVHYSHRSLAEGKVARERTIALGNPIVDDNVLTNITQNIINDIIESIDSSMLSQERNVGGIDIKDIDVRRKDGSTQTQFNSEAVRAVIENGFNGFTPVIINITPIESPLMILGEHEPGGVELAQTGV